jgi:Flp pilus assembly protein TadD
LRAGPIPGVTGRTEARGLAANGTRGQRTSARGAVAQTPDTLLAKAREAIRREALDEALELLKAAVRNNPRNPDALWELAVLYDRRLHSPEEAAKTYRKFKEAFPDDPRSRGIPPAARAGGARRP